MIDERVLMAKAHEYEDNAHISCYIMGVQSNFSEILESLVRTILKEEKLNENN